MTPFQASLLAMRIKEFQGKPCILCEKKSDGAGIFVPDHEFASKIGQPKGKLRLCVYAICSRCQRKKKDWCEQVENRMLKQYFDEHANPQN